MQKYDFLPFDAKKGAIYLQVQHKVTNFASQTDAGGLAQLARALAWHARGHRFDSDILHKKMGSLHTEAAHLLYVNK